MRVTESFLRSLSIQGAWSVHDRVLLLAELRRMRRLLREFAQDKLGARERLAKESQLVLEEDVL